MSKCRFNEYDVIHYNRRKDGRIELAGRERRIMTNEEAVELSFTALVITRAMGFGGEPIVMHEGKHAQFDAHLGWVS